MIKVVVLTRTTDEPIIAMLVDLLAKQSIAEIVAVCDSVSRWNQRIEKDSFAITILDGRLPELSSARKVTEFLSSYAPEGMKFIYFSENRNVFVPDCQACLTASVSPLLLSATIVLVSFGYRIHLSDLEERLEEGAVLHGLSAREGEILRLIANGQTNRQIAEQLGIAVGTVKNYTSRIFQRLGLRSRTNAALWAQDRLYEPSRYDD